jgi:peptide/nickel transport system ATP-binding protein
VLLGLEEGITMGHSRDENLLQIEDLTKVFAIRQGLSVTRFVAVDRARFAVKSASPEIFTLVGESGSGKTTLARMILGLEEPTSGSVCFRSRDVTGLSRKERRSWFMKEVQPVFQDPFATFSPLKRIETYLYETAFNYDIVERAQANEYIDEVLRSVGLSLREVRGRYPNELSGGQVQRISVARALITNPSLLVADEPVSMLDASLRMSIVNLLMELKQRKDVSVIYITHDLATAYYVADHIAIMLRGWIVEMGSVEKVLGNPLHPYTQLLRRSVPQADPDKKWHDKINLATLEMEEYLMAGCRFAGRCPHTMDVCEDKEPRNHFVDGRMVKCFLYEGKTSE